MKDSLTSVSGAEYRRVCEENAQLRAHSFWKNDCDLLLRGATLLDLEATTWAEGFATKDGNNLIWPSTDEWAKVRHHNLTRTAQRLREMSDRIYRERQAIKSPEPSLDGRSA
jgi:hypothetical protein